MDDSKSESANLFQELEKCLLKDQSIKESLYEDMQGLEQCARQIGTTLQIIHQQNTTKEAILDICRSSRAVFKTVETHYESISFKIPDGQYYKFCSQWQNISSKLCFLASLVIYLEDGCLASRKAVMDLLGVKVDPRTGFHVDLEEYLSGLLSLASELARLAVNSVIAGNYARPILISKFVSDLESGFRLLNLKNDFLRKKYDGLKYDVKKIEQVVYDLKIRGLVPDLEKSEEKTETSEQELTSQ